MKCRICGSDEQTEVYYVREMMLGLRKMFPYFKCHDCGCLQLNDIPADMSEFYPADYYCYSLEGKSSLRRSLRKIRDKYVVSGVGFIGKILYMILPDETLRMYSGVSRESRILDVGCGSGNQIRRLKDTGFKNLSGIDPYIPESILYSDGSTVEKKKLIEVVGKWDLITYHHSFEHLAYPLEELKKVSDLLSDNGSCLIRIPVVDSFAWNKYGTDWVQIDAPRHVFIYSVNSFEMLAQNAGFKIVKTEYDSTAFQFWGSEQYKMDIPLYDKRSYSVNPGKSFFTNAQIDGYKAKAKSLNNVRMGDQAAFWLCKK